MVARIDVHSIYVFIYLLFDWIVSKVDSTADKLIIAS